jgi:bacterioferritin
MEDTHTPQNGAPPADDPAELTLTGAQQLRYRARKNVEDGAVTAAFTLDPRLVCGLLNRALATEIVCVLRYRRHHFMAGGISSASVAAEFLAHSNEEQGHADRLAERIVQLGGEPDLNPAGLTIRSHAEYVEGRTLQEMVHEDLVAERIAIESYTETINFLAGKDPTTRRMLEEILAKEEEHAEDLSSLIKGWRPPLTPTATRKSGEAETAAPTPADGDAMAWEPKKTARPL